MSPDNKNSFLLITSGLTAGLALSQLYSRYTKYHRRKSSALYSVNTKVKFEYFPIAGAGEKVRLALTLVGVPFDDEKIAGDAWRKEGSGRKFTAKYGQLPILTLGNGEELYQSYAMLRYIGAMDPQDKLYPSDPEKRLKVDVALGVLGDLQRAFLPALCVGFKPAYLGYSADMKEEDKKAVVKSMRETFIAEELPKYMKYILDLITENGGKYLCGDDVTIADLDGLHSIMYFSKGIADHIPKDTLDKYPEIQKWIENVMEYPPIKEYYGQQNK
mmetsp:Transcript_17148/g.23563  ORF Transcript_17148/g.23563 Transcript_17148/m.23563 type:complete len:273 (-) Transcript_17148:224-1042(-)